VDLQLRNRTTHEFFRQLSDGEWLSAPLPGRPVPPTLANYQRAGWTLTNSTFEGRTALRVDTGSGSQLIVPEFDYFSVEQDNATLSMRCRGLKTVVSNPSDFMPPPGVTPKLFATVAALNAYADAKGKAATQ